jgi:hypothetical protein
VNYVVSLFLLTAASVALSLGSALNTTKGTATMRNSPAHALLACRQWLADARAAQAAMQAAPVIHHSSYAAHIRYAIAQARRAYARLRFAPVVATHAVAADGTFRAVLVLRSDPALWVARSVTPYKHRQSAARAALNRHNRGLWLGVCVAGSTAAGYAMQALGIVP